MEFNYDLSDQAAVSYVSREGDDHGAIACMVIRDDFGKLGIRIRTPAQALAIANAGVQALHDLGEDLLAIAAMPEIIQTPIEELMDRRHFERRWLDDHVEWSGEDRRNKERRSEDLADDLHPADPIRVRDK